MPTAPHHRLPLLLSALCLTVGCAKPPPPEAPKATPPTPTVTAKKPLIRAPSGPLRLWSDDFSEGQPIPRRFTCEGDDDTPSLFWRGVPPRTRSLALIIDDPDAPDPAAPRMTWVHWVLLGIPPDANGITVDGEHSGLPAGVRRGRNDFSRTTYGGPCPPIGRHRYYHRLYALDVDLAELIEPAKDQLTAAMDGHILASATLMGTYIKQAPPASAPEAVSAAAVPASGTPIAP